MYRYLVLFLCLLLSACASNIPRQISEPVPNSPAPGHVQQNASQYEQSVVRWGGVIIGLENTASDSLLEISGRELNTWGEPINSDQGLGRFLVRIDAPLDESIYREQRRITVFGQLETPIKGTQGQDEAHYPVVQVDTHYLWPEPYYSYYSADPFYDSFFHYPSPMHYRARHFYPYHPYRYHPLRYRYPFSYHFHYGYPRW